MADSVCQAPPNFQGHYKLKFFQQKIRIFSNKYFFSSHLIQCYARLMSESQGDSTGLWPDFVVKLSIPFHSSLEGWVIKKPEK